MAFGDFLQGIFTDNPGSPNAVALGANVTAGNLLIAAFTAATNGASTVTDSQGNTWAQATSNYSAGSDYRAELWYAVAGSSGAVTIEITAPGGAREILRAEYEGPFDLASLDKVANANGSSGSASSGAQTPVSNGQLILGFIVTVTTSTITPTGSFGGDLSDNGTPTTVKVTLESFVQATAASVAATATISPSAVWFALLATFPESLGSTKTFDGLTFSGNTFDINNTSGATQSVQTSNGANPTTYEGDIVNIISSVAVSVTVIDKNNDPIQNAQVSMYLSSDDSEVMNQDTDASGQASTSFGGAVPTSVYWRVRKSSSGGTKYKNVSGVGTIAASTGMSITVTLYEDPINSA